MRGKKPRHIGLIHNTNNSVCTYRVLRTDRHIRACIIGAFDESPVTQRLQRLLDIFNQLSVQITLINVDRVAHNSGFAQPIGSQPSWLGMVYLIWTRMFMIDLLYTRKREAVMINQHARNDRRACRMLAARPA